jgi:hypothetical protein
MNLLTPTFVYYQAELPVEFQDISISCLDSITVAEISAKHKDLQGIENIELGKLRIWIVVLNNSSDLQSLNLDTLKLDTLKDDVKKAIGVRHIEISCLILSNQTLTTSSSIIQSLNKAKKQKWINHAVLLNNNNLSWIRSGSQILTSDDLLFDYGLKLIERLHYTNCFLGDLCDTFNNIGYDKYLLTIGSSILPHDLIIEKHEKKETYRLSEVFIEQNSIFWSAVNKFLNEKTQKQQKVEIDNSESDQLFPTIFDVINAYNQKLKGKKTNKENNPQKDKSSFFKTLYSRLNLENSYVNPYINNFKLQHYVPVIEELFTNQLCDFIQFLDSDLSDKQLLIERKSEFLGKIKNKSLSIYQNNDNRAKEIRSAQFVLNHAESPVDKQIKVWILEDGFEEEDDDEQDNALTIRSGWLKKTKSCIGTTVRGLLNSKKMEDPDNRNFVKFMVNRIIKEQEGDIINEIRKELRVLLKATDKNPAKNEDIRTMLSTLSNLKTIMSDNRKFDDKIFKTELEARLDLAFDAMQANPKFNQCLSLMVEIFMVAHNAAVINSREEIKIKFIPETEPFFCCSYSLEHINRIKQFVFTNQVISQNGNELLEYVETNLFINESLSIYGPWTEKECLEV